ncbi:MAG TPA: hypothetical protein VGE97_08970 [Nitrososphaera sp.]
MDLYNCISTPDGYRIVKFNDLMWVESVYYITYKRGRFYCPCEQGRKNPNCRHRDMIPIFNTHKAVNSGKFYCYEEDKWFPPVTG